MSFGWQDTSDSTNTLQTLIQYHVQNVFHHLYLQTNSIRLVINSLPNNKILDYSNFKAFADYKLKVVQNLKLVLGTVENIVGKGENAGYQHFLLMFSKGFSDWVVKSRVCSEKVKTFKGLFIMSV